MNYRNNNGNNDLSALGFGCMRFPKRGNGFDMEEVEKEILHAIKLGVNYFDTAYIYPGSEEALGTVLSVNGCREQVKIATTLPHYMMKTRADMEKHFNEELSRLKTDYIDYYLMHMLPDVKTWNILIERGALDWLTELKASGKIRNIGFSYHGSTHTFQA
ncbi:MAG TPA: aldo/keto reductase, partial [Lachnospiraceae bacterium]|nr:aldo/keto reductase [Lachnospiraceae bacterium]